jgi:hypothetical protein
MPLGAAIMTREKCMNAAGMDNPRKISQDQRRSRACSLFIELLPVFRRVLDFEPLVTTWLPPAPTGITLPFWLWFQLCTILLKMGLYRRVTINVDTTASEDYP